MNALPDISELRPKKPSPKPQRAPEGMRTFTVFRTSDTSGVSGTGITCQGTLFANGKAAIQWLGGPDPGDVVVKDFDKWLDVHVKAHPENGTVITFDNDEQLDFREKTTENTD